MCLAGSVTIGKGGLTGEGEALKGDLLALIGASTFGAYFVVGRKVRRSMDFMEYVFHAYLASSLILLAYSLICGYSLKGYRSDNYLWFFLLAAGPQVFGHSSLNWAMKYLPAPKVAVSILGEPIGSSILAWIFFKEIPTRFLFAGALLILTGTYLALTEKRINGIETPA